MCVLRQLTGYSAPDERAQLAKYESRGWKEVEFDIDDELLEARSVGDSRCWNMLLDVKSIPSGKEKEKEECVRFALGESCVVMLKRA